MPAASRSVAAAELEALPGEDRALIERVAMQLQSQLPRLAAHVTDRIVERYPELGGPGGALLGAAQRASEANVQTLLTSLALHVDPQTLGVPDGNLEIVQHVAHRGDGLALILRAYQVGLMTFRHLWTRHLARCITEVDRFARIVVYCDAQATACAERVSDALSERWASLAREALTAGNRRAAAGRALLAGEPVDLAGIGYPEDAAHLVVAARSTLREYSDPTPVLTRLGDALAASQHLEAFAADGAAVWWIPAPRQTVEHDSVFATTPAGLWCVYTRSVGGARHLRLAADDVLAGLAVLPQIRPAGAAVEYSDVALITTLLADPARADRFARSVLGSLAGDDARSARLRDTLRAYFTAAERKAGAAALLGIHEKTVSYRLRTAEDQLGGPITARRADLEAALLVLSARRHPARGAPA